MANYCFFSPRLAAFFVPDENAAHCRRDCVSIGNNILVALPTAHSLSAFLRVAIVLLVLIPLSLAAQDSDSTGGSPVITFGGAISARTVFYDATAIAQRRKPFSYVLSGSVTANLFDIALPFSFTYSEQERSYSQPFNQFGVSPHYEWATVHLGYRSLTFSPFTLAGHQFLGAGIELNPGKFRFGMMYGQLQRAVEEDTLRAGAQPAYERTGFSGKIGYGTDNSYVDLIVVRAKDDATSLSKAPEQAGILPSENLVVGLSGRSEIASGITLHFDGAISDYTRDIRADLLDNNDDLAQTASSLLPVRTSTQLYTALSGGIALNFSDFSLNASFTRVDPDYQSMGAYYVSNDIQSITVAPAVVMFGGVLRANANLSLQHDNLQNKKAATTQRIIPVLNLSWSPSGTWGIDAQYTDVLTSQTAGNKPLNDTTRMEQSSPAFSLSARYTVGDSAISHAVFLNSMLQVLADRNRFTASYSEYTNTTIYGAYSLGFVPQNLTLTATAGGTRTDNGLGTITGSNVSIGAVQGMFDNTLSAHITLALSLFGKGQTINSAAGCSYAVTKQHTFSLDVSHMRSSAQTTENTTFSEFTAVASYVFSF